MPIHTPQTGRLVLVHNGIIENYESIRIFLKEQGFSFNSETDTEVLVNLIEHLHTTQGLKTGKAVQRALNPGVGAYAIAVFDKERHSEMIVAKLGSPLAIGLGKEEYFVASDASPFIEYTNRTIYLEDNEMAVISHNKGLKMYSILDNSRVDPNVQELKLSLDKIEKGGYDHFMLKEIHEQPRAIVDTFRGRLLTQDQKIHLSGLEEYKKVFLNAKRVIIIACGTSWHAGLVGEYLFEDAARIPVEVEYASEFRYRNPVIDKDDVVIAISQSGETADTLAAIKLAKESGAFVFGICNVVEVPLPALRILALHPRRTRNWGASTKAFTTQITLLILIGLRLGNYGEHYHLRVYPCCPGIGIPSQSCTNCIKSEKEIQQIAKITKTLLIFCIWDAGTISQWHWKALKLKSPTFTLRDTQQRK